MYIIPEAYSKEYPNIQAFNMGYRAFFHGEKVRYKHLSLANWNDLRRRIIALQEGDKKLAYNIFIKLIGQGFWLTDSYPNNDTTKPPIRTLIEIKTIASNPFLSGTPQAEEWDRGFNTAYSNNQKRKH